MLKKFFDEFEEDLEVHPLKEWGASPSKNEDILKYLFEGGGITKLSGGFTRNLPVDYREEQIREVLNGNKFKDVTIVNDAGSHVTWLTLYKECKRPRSLIFSGGFGSMGYGLGAAIGVAFARPNEPVLVVIGDGAFQMNSQDLMTIRKYRLPIIMCMINNDASRIVKQWQVLNYGEAYETDLDFNPNFEKLVKSYNIDYMEAYAPGDV